MKAKRIQVLLPEDFEKKFEAERKRQNRTESNFGLFCIRFYFDSINAQKDIKKSA